MYNVSDKRGFVKEFKVVQKRNTEFLCLPAFLFYDSRYKELSNGAKLLYGFILDKQCAADQEGIAFTIHEIIGYLQCGNQKAIRLLNELQEVGLIRKTRKRLGMPSVIELISDALEPAKRFIRIPRSLFGSAYDQFSYEGKLLYGLMVERMHLSVKNSYMDDLKRPYIFFTIQSIMEKLNCASQKACKILAELQHNNLITIRKSSRKANLIYVNECSWPDRDDSKVLTNDHREEIEKDSSIISLEEKGSVCTIALSYILERLGIPADKVGKLQINNGQLIVKMNSVNDAVNDYMCDNQKPIQKPNPEFRDKYKGFNHNRFTGDQIYEGYTKIIKKNISYDLLIESHNQEQIDSLVELLTETIAQEGQDMIPVARAMHPYTQVKSGLLKLTYHHIEYVLECMQKTTKKILNIKQYLLTSLFNSVITIRSYYQNEVNSKSLATA